MLESQLILGWLKQGRDEGVVKTKRADVLQVIAIRLQAPVPEDLVLAIEGTNDPTILHQWHKDALLASSIGDLRKAMKQS